MKIIFFLIFSFGVLGQNYEWKRQSLKSSLEYPCTRTEVFGVKIPWQERVFIFGGKSGNDRVVKALRDTWILDLEEMRWKQIYPTHSPAGRYGAVGGYNRETNSIFMTGGMDEYGYGLNDTYSFSLETFDWIKIPTYGRIPQNLSQSNGGISSNGGSFKLLIVFGLNNYYEKDESEVNEHVYELNTRDGKWVVRGGESGNYLKGSEEPLKRYAFAGAFVKPGVYTIFGGCSGVYGKCPHNDVWSYSLKNSIWVPHSYYVPFFNSLSSTSPPGRYECASTSIQPNELLVFGGRDSSHSITNDLFLISIPSSGSSSGSSSYVHLSPKPDPIFNIPKSKSNSLFIPLSNSTILLLFGTNTNGLELWSLSLDSSSSSSISYEESKSYIFMFFIILILGIIPLGGIISILYYYQRLPFSSLFVWLVHRTIGYYPRHRLVAKIFWPLFGSFTFGEICLLFLSIIWLVSWYCLCTYVMSSSQEVFARSMGWATMTLLGFIMLPVYENAVWLTLVGLPQRAMIRLHTILSYVFIFIMSLHFLAMFIHYRIHIFSFDASFSTYPTFGFVAFLLFLLLSTFSTEPIRRLNYAFFHLTHMLFIPAVLFSILHQPLTFYFVIPSFILWIFDFSNRQFRRYQSRFRLINTLHFSLPNNSSIAQLTIEPPPNFDWKPGQYLRINTPNYSYFQWHPFSITPQLSEKSNKSEKSSENIQIYIKDSGNNRFTSYMTKMAMLRKVVEVKCDGPFGGMTLQLHRYKMLFLVAGGIGITFISSVVMRLLQDEDYEYTAIHVLWTNSSPEIFGIFASLIKELNSRRNCWVHLFISNRDSHRYDVTLSTLFSKTQQRRRFYVNQAAYRTSVLDRGSYGPEAWPGESIPCGLISNAHYLRQRPSFREYFYSLINFHSLPFPIAAIVSGPSSLVGAVQRISYSLSTPTHRIDLHREYYVT